LTGSLDMVITLILDFTISLGDQAVSHLHSRWGPNNDEMIAAGNRPGIDGRVYRKPFLGAYKDKLPVYLNGLTPLS